MLYHEVARRFDTIPIKDMRKVYVLGTIHGNYVPKEELAEELAKLNPTQMFVELPDKSLEQIIEGGDVRDEMIFADSWGRERNIPVYRFDTDRDTLRAGMTVDSPDFKKLFSDQLHMLKKLKLSWKEFNRRENDTALDHPLENIVSDPTEFGKREEEMLRNIRHHMSEQGVVLILTGAKHLSFFEKQLPEAVFPLRT
jgi:hypothetical protein